MSVTSKTPSFGRIEVHTPEILEEITTDVKDDPYYPTISSWHRNYDMNMPMAKSSSPKSRSTSVGRWSGQRRGSHAAGCRIQSWLNEDSVRDVQGKTSRGSRSIRNIYTAVLENEDMLSQDLDRCLEFNDISNENKKQMLFKKWTEKVYTPLKGKIDAEMSSDNFKNYTKMKNELYQKYLEYRNKKGMVFLDVYSHKEYDPMQLNNPRPGPLKARVNSLDQNDPLCLQDFKRVVEDEETLRCQTGRKTNLSEVKTYNLPVEPLVPLGRANTTCATWLRMPIHDIDSPPRLKSRQKMRWTTNESQIDFNKWQKPTPTQSNPKIVDFQLHSQKKRYYPEKYTTRQILQWPTPCQTQETVTLPTKAE